MFKKVFNWITFFIYIYKEKRQKIIDELRLVEKYNNEISKIINLLENASNQPSKFRTKH